MASAPTLDPAASRPFSFTLTTPNMLSWTWPSACSPWTTKSHSSAVDGNEAQAPLSAVKGLIVSGWLSFTARPLVAAIKNHPLTVIAIRQLHNECIYAVYIGTHTHTCNGVMADYDLGLRYHSFFQASFFNVCLTHNQISAKCLVLIQACWGDSTGIMASKN